VSDVRRWSGLNAAYATDSMFEIGIPSSSSRSNDTPTASSPAHQAMSLRLTISKSLRCNYKSWRPPPKFHDDPDILLASPV
jgi:hypothetical protein